MGHVPAVMRLPSGWRRGEGRPLVPVARDSGSVPTAGGWEGPVVRAAHCVSPPTPRVSTHLRSCGPGVQEGPLPSLRGCGKWRQGGLLAPGASEAGKAEPQGGLGLADRSTSPLGGTVCGPGFWNVLILWGRVWPAEIDSWSLHRVHPSGCFKMLGWCHPDTWRRGALCQRRGGPLCSCGPGTCPCSLCEAGQAPGMQHSTSPPPRQDCQPARPPVPAQWRVCVGGPRLRTTGGPELEDT